MKNRIRTDIDHRGFQLFCFGYYVEPAEIPLSPSEQKIYNMLKAGYPKYRIAEQLGITLATIAGRVSDMRKKGWDV